MVIVGTYAVVEGARAGAARVRSDKSVTIRYIVISVINLTPACACNPPGRDQVEHSSLHRTWELSMATSKQ
jgi:hypothetical protein